MNFAYHADDVYSNVDICLFVATKETLIKVVDGSADWGADNFGHMELRVRVLLNVMWWICWKVCHFSLDFSKCAGNLLFLVVNDVYKEPSMGTGI